MTYTVSSGTLNLTQLTYVTLKLCKEYLNTVTSNTPVLLRIKYWTVWSTKRYSMSTCKGVSNFQETVRFWPILYIVLPGCEDGIIICSFVLTQYGRVTDRRRELL